MIDDLDKTPEELRDDAWRLLVQSRTFDMLLDRIPWSFSTLSTSGWNESSMWIGNNSP